MTSRRTTRRRYCTKALRRNSHRAQLFETLEPRMMLNADWHNRPSPLDVNNDWLLTPMDALLVINRLNSQGAVVLPHRSNTLDFYYDVNGDQLSTPIDALLIINQLNQGGSRIITPTYSEGESAVSPAGFISIPMAKLPGLVGQSVALSINIEVGRKQFNEMGLFVMDGPDGSVGGVLPSSPDYAAAVFQSGQRQVLYSRTDQFHTERELVFPAGQHVSVYVLQQYSSSDNPTDHLRVRKSASGSTRIGWEEQTSILAGWPVVGDRGYDDVTVDLKFGEPFDGTAQPIIAAIPNQTIDELSELSMQLTVANPGSAPGQLTWSKTSGPAGLQIDSRSGRLTWTPSENDGPGQFEVIVSVSNGALSNARRFIVRVDEVNVAPTIANINDQVVAVGAALSVTAVASDADIPSNALTYRLDTGPTGATIDAQSGLIRWSPTAAGEANFVVRVTDAGGLFTTTSFRVTTGDNSVLSEGSAFQTELTRELTLPNDTSAVRVTFEAPSFDLSSKRTIRDAFEIEVTDLMGNPLTFPYAPNRDAVYNWSEGLGPVFGAGVATTTNPAGQPSTATINLSGLAAGSRIRVTTRLVNNDSDNATSVIVGGFEVIPASDVLPAGVPGASSRLADYSAVDISKLRDISSSFVPSYGRTTLAGDNNQLVVELLVTNLSNQTATGRVIVAIDNISEPSARAMRPDGFLPDGRPYFDMTADINGGAWAPGESLRSREIRFLNDSDQRFSYRLSVLGELNTAPTAFDSVPLAEIEADRTYRYQSRAVDPEGQALTYSVTAGPETLTVDPTTGVVTWATTEADIGRNQVTLRATDPFGLFVEQSFDIQVFASLQNRPPVFVSTPETEAIAGSGFEVSTVQTGENPVGVAVANIGLDNGTLVTINRGTQTLSQISASGNDRYELLTELTVGEPGPVDQILRSGYNIDVGLPPYLQQFEGNSIRGMDQADLNGDGLPDIVISAQVQTRIPSTVYTQVINVVFGEGDGKFSEPVTVASTTTTNASNPRTLKLADFDQDGTIDILALNVHTASLYLLRGAGDGSFSPVEVMAIATTLNDFKTVDLNQDGILDLIGATSDTRSLGYMLGNGDGTFSPFTSTVTSTNQIFNASFPGRNYAASDMDGDGDIDLVFSHFQDGTVNVLANDGNLNFTSAGSLIARRPFGGSGSASLYSVFVGDFNGDALMDIAYGAAGYTSNDTGSLGIFIRDSSGFTFTFQDGVDSIADNPGNWAGNSEPIDVDGDGDLDILVGGVSTFSNFDTIPSVLRNRGDGTFTASNLSLPFADKSPYETIHNDGSAVGILAGDYNGDGMLDLIAFKSENTFSSSTYSTVSVILADRPGEFASSDILHYTASGAQRFFESGDFNNDGIVDLWSPGYQRPSRTWLGRGDGTFDEPIIATPYIGNEFLSKGFVGDFDQDGNLDVFWLGNGGVQNGPTSRFLAALGNGDGTFRITFTQSSGTSIVLPGDFNGDGYLDFAARKFGESLDIYSYDVANPGTWQQAYSFPFSSLGSSIGDYRETLTVADFNLDGELDLAFAYQLSGGDVQLAVLPGVGDGSLAAPISSPYGVSVPDYSSPAELASGDLNEDGIADLVVYDSLAVGIHLGVGDGTFGTPMVIPANDPRSLTGNVFVRDFDYDGHQDILFNSSLNLAQLNFLRGDGRGNFEERVTYAPSIESGYVEFGDLDNDGRDEVIVSDPTGTNFVSILYAARERLTDIVTADLNRDGNDDVLATNFDNSRVKWFLGNNLGQLVKQPDLLTDNGPVGLVVADLNQDATNEIVTVNRSGRSVSIFAGSGSTYARTDFSVGRTPIALTAAFVDADSSQDLLVLDGDLNAVWFLRGNNDLTFAAAVPILLGDRPNDMVAGDVNNDGFTDIVVSLLATKRLMILPGDGTGNFGAPTYVALAGSPTAIGFSDFNQDGRGDLAVAMSERDEVAILYGRGQLQFAKPQSILVGDQPASLTISDADGDGRDDIIVANRGDNTASVIFNRFDPTKVYRYDALAIDPDDDSVSYELVDAPGGMILDATTGQILWAPSAEQIGSQLVTIAASDGRGGVGTQSFYIDVAPARENNAPLIATLPQTVVAADQAFSYSLQATDRDNNALRYRLLEGPAGATVDPITGLVTWDARQAATRTNQYTQVSQNLIVPATAALQPASVTAEGWFKFESPSASETLIRKTNGFSGNSYQLSFVGGILRATVGMNTSSSGNVFVTYNLNRETGRWYHLAMSFDDVSKQLSLYVDGQQVATTTADLTIGYDDDVDVLIGGPGTKVNGEIGSIRIWNEARPQALLQQSMSLEADYTDPTLLLDLDFNATEAQTLRDKSSYQHVAVRSGTGDIYPHRVPGLAFEQTAPFIVSVEDGRGGYDQQSFNVSYVPPLRGSLAGSLFEDLNANGAKEASEAVLSNWLVYVDLNGNQYPDPNEPKAVSNVVGQYQFDKLLPGSYPLHVQPRAGFATPPRAVGDVVANQQNTVDFAIEQLALGQIGGQVTTVTSSAAARWKVFADLNDNGLLDPAEPFTSTDELGNFAITGLDAGDYRLRAEMLPGWQVTGPSSRFIDVILASNGIETGNDFVVRPSNTTASSGLQFVTTPNLSGANEAIVAGVTYRYDSLAIGLLDQAVSYDLSLAPEGVSVDPATGLLLWRPSLRQVGEQRVILRATDASDGVTLQDFSLNVIAPNTAPFITSTAPTLGYHGVEVTYSIQAQDADNDTLTYTLVSGPVTTSVDFVTGRFTWIPAANQVGVNNFVVSVRDTSGNVTEQAFALNVSATTPTTTPFSLSPVRTQAAINQAYRSHLSVQDAMGRALPVSLVSGPNGLTLDGTGIVRWIPSTHQFGLQTLVVSANDGLGNSQQFTISINVAQRLVNTAPHITSAPVLYSVADQPYVYDAIAVDAEHDPAAYELLEAPSGMSIHSDSGTLRWLPNRELVGEHAISILVTDAVGASTLQSYVLRVRSAGGPPQIVSVPPTEAAVGTAWLYTVIANDLERDPLTYTLLTAPSGVIIDAITGELSWTPQAGQVGLNSIAIQVTDGSGGSTSQSFSIRVAAGVPNLPPTISTQPNRFASVGTLYSYLPSATDPEGQTIVYSLRRAPAAMTVNAVTGRIDWTPSAGDTGKAVVTLIATDAGGAAAVQSFELDVLAANQVPAIVSSPSLSIAAGAIWRYTVVGRDADLDPLRYEMIEAPVGAIMDAFGEVQWSTAVANIGSHVFRFRVSDPRGGVVEQSFTLQVVADTVAPRVTVLPDKFNPFPWNGPIHVYVSAVDNVAIASVTMTVNGRDVPLDANNHAALYVEDWGYAVLNIVATATDTAGNVGQGQGVTYYNDPEVDGDTNAPTVTITSPVESASVTGFVDIIGTAAGANVNGYRLLYRRADQPEPSFKSFATGTTAVTDGVLGKWDTTLLNNDEYIIRLEVSNTSGRTEIIDRQVGLSGALKLGNFRLSFTDMVIPVAGIPIEITRIYDTLQADREGDFGFGWRLEYRNTDLRVGLPKSGLEDIGIYSPLKSGVKVYLNVPGQGRQGFTFTPEIRVLPGLGDNVVVARPRFTPDRGVTSTLSTGTNSYLLVNELGELFAPGGIPYNPASPDFGGAYDLTTQEGITYRIDGRSGDLLRAKDQNGNFLQFRPDGIAGSAGLLVKIARDSSGRISAIKDPDANQLKYSYDQNGNLSQVVDREGHSTLLGYHSIRRHYLETIVDPIGRTATRAEYDDSGKLTKLFDAAGNPLVFDYDLSSNSTTFLDQRGNQTTLIFDQAGNVVAEVNALGHSTYRTYDQNNNITSETSAAGYVTTYAYDSRDNLLATTDSSGASTRYSYDASNSISSVSDAAGFTTRMEYDSRGNLIAQIDATGSITTLAVNSNGTVNKIQTPAGLTLSYGHDKFGNQTRVESPLSGTTLLSYGASGNLTSQVHEGLARTDLEYNANGNLILFKRDAIVLAAEYDPAGSVSSVASNGKTIHYQYGAMFPEKISGPNNIDYAAKFDEVGNLLSTTGPLNAGLSFSYDALGQRISTRIGSVDFERLTYDRDGLVINSVDAIGGETLYVRDSTGRVTTVSNALGAERSFQYDIRGNVSVEVDPLGRETFHEYDANNRLTTTHFADGSFESFRYDSAGNQVEFINANSSRTRFGYDALGRLTSLIDAYGTTTTYTYDKADNLVEIVDANGNGTRHEYDSLGNRVKTTSPMGGVVENEFDTQNRLIRTRLPDGESIQYVYSDSGLKRERTTSEGNTEVYSYTADGLIGSVVDQHGTTLFTYDQTTRLITSTTQPDGSYVRYEYNRTGKRTLVAYALSSQGTESIWTYDYDLAGQLTAMHKNGQTTEFSYDLAGNLVAILYPNSTITTFRYNSRNEVVEIQTLDSSGSVLQRIDYQLDAIGNRLYSESITGEVTYNYDSISRVISEEHRRINGDRLTIAYEYDALSNLVRRTETSDTISVVEFAYDAENKLLSGGDSTYTYDELGRLTGESSSSGTIVYEYDVLNRMTKSVDRFGVSTTYDYSFDGTRIGQSMGGNSIRYIVDRFQPSGISQVIATVHDNGRTSEYSRGVVLTAVSTAGEQYFIHPDALGSTRLTTSALELVIDRFDYTAYGELLEPSSSSTLSFLFAGEQLDESGLYYLRDRHYSPTLGRFLIRDPLDGEPNAPATFNLYLYANANPINFVDPLGQRTLVETLQVLQQKAFSIKQDSKQLQTFFKQKQKIVETGAQLLLKGAGAAAVLATVRVFDNPAFAARWFGVLGTPLGIINTLLTAEDAITNKNVEARPLFHPRRPGAPALVRNKQNPIYVLTPFLTYPPLPIGSINSRASMAGIMFHEQTHISVKTSDQAYACAAVRQDGIGKISLSNIIVDGPSNADSYRCFLRDATLGGSGN